jgi:hypothetical protein
MDLSAAAKVPFLHAAKTFGGSLLYLDAGAGEFVHVNLGLKFVFGKPETKAFFGDVLSLGHV